MDARPLAVPTTGIGRYTQEIVSRLVDTEHQVFLYGFHPICVSDSPRNLKVYTASTQPPWMSTLHSQLVFPRWAKADQIDVFWSPRHHLPLLADVPTVVTIHDMVWKRHGETMARLGRRTESLLMPPSLRKARRVIAVSKATAQDIIAFFPAIQPKITVIQEASTLTSVAANTDTAPAPAPPYMLFVGTMEPRKNLESVLDAFRDLIERGGTSYRLVIAGNAGWKNEGVHRRLRTTPLKSRVTLLGHVSDAELVSLYRNADFVVAPSLYEGFGLVVLDAMYFGKPVITGNLSSMPEVAGDAALLVDPNDVGQIEHAMRRLIEDRALNTELGARGLSRSREFSWERAARETLGVLKQVANDA